MPKFDPKQFLSTNLETSPDRTIPEGSFSDADELEPLFEKAFDRQRKPSDFLDSLYEWWQDKAFLTKKQYNALKKFAGEE